jgi:hypothetical protein
MTFVLMCNLMCSGRACWSGQLHDTHAYFVLQCACMYQIYMLRICFDLMSCIRSAVNGYKLSRLFSFFLISNKISRTKNVCDM